MASSSSSAAPSHPVIFTTQTPYALPSQKFMIPLDWKRYQLSQLINKALDLPKPIPFDFLVHGEILRTSLLEWRAEKGVGEEDTLEIEYFESVMPPQRMSELPHEDWVSSVSCRIPQHFISASYDGHLRLFDYSQNLVLDASAHQSPITSVCVVPSSSPDTESHILASSSHDLTACLTRISLSPESPIASTVASLHLHTSPLSFISTDASGSHLLTSSWDGLIGVWDTLIPDDHQKKRRKTAPANIKRKAPTAVLKSHTARVSKALFAAGELAKGKAYSCGFDSTVRTWDVESGVCINTINVPERPMLDLAETPDGNVLLAASTDRTVSIFDLRISSLSSSTGIMMHPATPSCIATSESGKRQVVTGSYDGIMRLWDLRSTKGAVTSFRVWDRMKVLAVDWVGDVVAIGGEGGMEVWRIAGGS
ncbi:ribosome biogenesis protein YTM1 [Suillus subalutaceus]|uniref:ribosome biogenesis protein YTM1 n=1 Tax=Suillus subalutaceus TaxID=48586 RepID=UPI001B87C19E|nr:ribosome biogenesis protein YTM1 [Suillus subalutaceus]KAG1850815.1 ribosome biogenesis protein YTM1 [Suillus subalutaceus]